MNSITSCSDEIAVRAEITLHAVGARTGVEDDRPACVAARRAQCALEFGRLQIGGRHQSLALERLAAAQFFELLRVNDVEAGFAKEPFSSFRQRTGVVAALRAHVACRATRKVNDAFGAASGRHDVADGNEWAAATPATTSATGRQRHRAACRVSPASRVCRSAVQYVSTSRVPTRTPAVTAPKCSAANVADSFCDWAGPPAAQRLDQYSGFDADRACGRA